MTTAHRPTWHSVLGGENQGGNVLASSTRDARTLGNLSLKLRDQTVEDLQAGQLESEMAAEMLTKANGILDEVEAELRTNNTQISVADVDCGKSRKRVAAVDVIALREKNKGGSESSEDSASDSEDLEMELAAIRREREQKAQSEMARKGEIDRQTALNNPLMVDHDDVKIKRNWEEDSVFRNQARSEEQGKKRFINDSVRSDFHKKFLRRYIK